MPRLRRPATGTTITVQPNAQTLSIVEEYRTRFQDREHERYATKHLTPWPRETRDNTALLAKDVCWFLNCGAPLDPNASGKKRRPYR